MGVRCEGLHMRILDYHTYAWVLVRLKCSADQGCTPGRAGPLIWGLLFMSAVTFGGVAFVGLLPAIIVASLAFGAAVVGLGVFATATAFALPSIFALVRRRVPCMYGPGRARKTC